jgi:carbon monoxide dehydrogenase subunit G
MKISGSNVIDQPVDKVWDALLDPRVLVATIPGCERLEATGDHQYAMTVTAGVAAIKGTYNGSCALSDLQEHRSLVMRLSGAGAPGTVDATVNVAFSEPAPGQTQIAYDADAVVGGMVGGVGQRMLSSVSKRMAGEFFGNVGQEIASPGGRSAGAASAVETADAPGVFTAPAKTGGISSQDDFLKGVAVGAGLVVLGVVIGPLVNAVFGRRR